jgi:putative ABC transport system permease protein
MADSVGTLLVAFRFIRGDLRRHPVEAAVFLLAVTAATATLAMGLALNGATGTLYGQTRAATAGPDVVAESADGQPAVLPSLMAVARAPGVIGHSGPYPIIGLRVKANSYTVQAAAQGRSTAPAAIDRPLVTSGSWLRPGGVVVERGFARALGVRVGDLITVAGRVFPVVGLAVSAADQVYPWAASTAPPGEPSADTGMIWLTQADIRALSAGAAARLLCRGSEAGPDHQSRRVRAFPR